MFPACSYFQNPLGKVWWIICTLIGSRNLIIMLFLRSVLYISTSSLFDWVSVVIKWILMPKLARCLHNLYLFMCGSRGGGGSDPASTVHPKKYQEFQTLQKNIWNFSNPKNIPILYLDLKKKTLNCIEMTSN